MQTIDHNGNVIFDSDSIENLSLKKKSDEIKSELTTKLYELKYLKDNLPSERDSFNTLKDSNLLKGFTTLSIHDGLKVEVISSLNEMMSTGYHLTNITTYGLHGKIVTHFSLRNESFDKSDAKLVTADMKRRTGVQQEKTDRVTKEVLELRTKLSEQLEQERLDQIPEEDRLFSELFGEDI